MDVRKVQSTKGRPRFGRRRDLGVDVLDVVIILKRDRLRSQDVLNYSTQVNFSDDRVFAPAKHLVADAVLGGEVPLDDSEERLTELFNNLGTDRETMAQGTRKDTSIGGQTQDSVMYEIILKESSDAVHGERAAHAPSECTG